MKTNSQFFSKENSPIRSAVPNRLEHLGPAAVLFEAEGILERRVERYIDLLNRSPGAYVSAALEQLAGEATRLASRIHARLAAIDPSVSAFTADEASYASD